MKNRNVIAIVVDDEYALKAMALFGAIRRIGKWEGDLAVIGNNLRNKLSNQFSR